MLANPGEDAGAAFASTLDKVFGVNAQRTCIRYGKK